MCSHSVQLNGCYYKLSSLGGAVVIVGVYLCKYIPDLSINELYLLGVTTENLHLTNSTVKKCGTSMPI